MRTLRTAMILSCALGLVGCATTLESGPPEMGWEVCLPEQVQVMVLGTFHFSQQQAVDILAPDRQEELAELLDRLAEFAPDHVMVEHPWVSNGPLNEAYRAYLAAPETSLASANETGQIGFRLARRLGHDRIHAVDVRMNLWHDSIQVFDDRYPDARADLRRRWNVRYPPSPTPDPALPLVDLLRPWNVDAAPSMAEYGLFMPLVEGDIYVGALKLRPWYDRNLRIVQNFFRVLEEGDERLFMIVGGSHVRVLRQILDLTPQLCAVSALPYLRE